MVLSAFAAELFLKCLLVLETGAAQPTHRLDVLFKRVSHKRQRKIQELWEADCRPKLMPLCRALNLPSDLSNALVKCGSAFENLRYYYEQPDKVAYYIGDFAWILMRVIVEIEPEWIPEEPSPVALGTLMPRRCPPPWSIDTGGYLEVRRLPGHKAASRRHLAT
jgi:hypothetical protein